MFLTGYVYDIFGVKWALFFGTFISAASLMLYPLGAPHLWILYTGGVSLESEWTLSVGTLLSLITWKNKIVEKLYRFL
jgi:hypothetical protein